MSLQLLQGASQTSPQVYFKLHHTVHTSLQYLAGTLDIDCLVGLLLGAEGPEGDGLVGCPVPAGLQALEHGIVQVVSAGVAVVTIHTNRMCACSEKENQLP